MKAFSRLSQCIALIILTSISTFTQTNNVAPEYGDISEIKEARRVYVYSQDYKARQKILQEIEKERTLSVVGKPEEAEFFISYGITVETGFSVFGGIFGGVLGRTTETTNAEEGEFYVVMRGDKLEGGGNRPRIIWGGRRVKPKSNPFIKTKDPATYITREFLKSLKKVRA